MHYFQGSREHSPPWGLSRVKSFNNTSLIIVRQRQHEISLIKKQKKTNLQQVEHNLEPIGIPAIRRYNFEPNLINIFPKDNGEHHTFSEMTTNYIF